MAQQLRTQAVVLAQPRSSSQHPLGSSPVPTVPKIGISDPLLVFGRTAHMTHRLNLKRKKKQNTIVSVSPSQNVSLDEIITPAQIYYF